MYETMDNGAEILMLGNLAAMIGKIIYQIWKNCKKINHLFLKTNTNARKELIIVRL